MKILVVDDTEAILLLISRFVEALGHQAILARNGQEAIDVWRAERPDLVLMDVMMPIMSGPEAAVQIKAESGATWVPIVFVTGVGEENALADAIERGADDYINKPVNFRVLEAKLKAFGRTLDLNRKVREQSQTLADYYEHAEEEKRVVRHLMEQMVNSERLADPQFEYWLSPAESLSGDLIAAARTPGQALHILLADGIGHGLTAALNVLPLTQPFYSMTEKGYSISDILFEMNSKVRQVLPIGRFVCVALISIDEVGGTVEVWNGGMPPIQVLNAQGEVSRVCNSGNLPLGIVPSHSLDLVPERLYFKEPGFIVAYSDGLVEARNKQKAEFGLDALLATLAKSSKDSMIANVQAELSEFLAGEQHHDDVSLVVAQFGVDGLELNKAAPVETNVEKFEDISPQFSQTADCNWRYSLILSAQELRYLNTIPFMMSFVKEIKTLTHVQSDVFLILTELFVNALDHGLLLMDSKMKSDPDGMESYLAQRAERLANLQEGKIEIDLMGLKYKDSEVLKIRLKDSGLGFDWADTYNANDKSAIPSDSFGRGVTLVRALAMKVQYIGLGNEVEVYYMPPKAT
ncbi:SpoIIE family protein phosphatase [Chitinibacter bivalviorum]|uniref:SpoIIE family protein phosphatase n=1 Tax=Chitinibacter bivalviorum TaxID=2739434 RepID=A0A7H9BG84_9NEIS|nr:SpoIIE family protein phosphatase [Chitinibacter bivalviorum]QLG87266.1 SpoIIE family protein phosphatase [Chitinibacter bivalviorum]